MKLMILLLSLCASSVFAAPTAISTWNQNAASPQAVVHDALYKSLSLGLSGKHVLFKAPAGVTAADQVSSVTCNGKSLGMLMVMSYRCLVQGDLSVWTYDGESVQAVLHGALVSAYKEDKESPYPQNQIQYDGKTVSVSDETSTIACTADTIGMAMAISYSCTIR